MRPIAKYQGGVLLHDWGLNEYVPVDYFTLRLERNMIQARIRERVFETTKKHDRKLVSDIDKAIAAFMKDRAA